MAKDYGIGQQIEEQQIDVYVPEYDVTVKASPAASANVVNNLAMMKVSGGKKGFNSVGGWNGTSLGDAMRSFAERKYEGDSSAWAATKGAVEGFAKGVARFPMDISAQLYDLYTSGSNYMSEAIYKSDVKSKKDRIVELQARIKSFEGIDEDRREKATRYYNEEISKLQDELKNLESDNFKKYLLETQKERKKASEAYAEGIDKLVGLPKSEVASGFESIVTSLLMAPAGPVGLATAYGTAGAGDLLVEMKERGVDSDEAMRWSTIGGVLIGIANTIGDRFILTKAVENITAKSGLMALLKGAFAGGVGEFSEESTESFATDVVREVAGINDKNAGQVVSDAIVSGIMGFIGGFVFGAGSSGLELKWKKQEKAKNVEKFKEVGLSQETAEKIAQKIYDTQDVNSIKEEVANLMTEDIDPSKYKDSDMQKDIEETVSIIPEMMNRFLTQNEIEVPKAETQVDENGVAKPMLEEKESYTISGVEVTKENMPALHNLLFQAEASGEPITNIAEALQKIDQVSGYSKKQKLREQFARIEGDIQRKLQRRYGEAYGRSVGKVVAANVYAGAKMQGITPEEYYQRIFPQINQSVQDVSDLMVDDSIPYQIGRPNIKVKDEEGKISTGGKKEEENIYNATNSNEEPVENVASFNRFIEGTHATENDDVVSETNPPKKIFRGDTRYFEEYTPQENAHEYDWGTGFYLSDDYDDVVQNYQSGGADLTNRINREAEQYAEDNDISYDEAREQLRKKYEQEDIVREFYLSMKNPVIIGGDKETFFDFEESYDEETDEYGEPTGTGVELISAIESYLYDIGADSSVGAIKDKLFEGFVENGGLSASQLEDIIRGTEEADYLVDYNSSPGEMLSNAFKRLGFDGIIDHRASTKFKNMNMNPDTTHYIVFDSNQAKSVDNKGEWSTSPNFYLQSISASIVDVTTNTDPKNMRKDAKKYLLDVVRKQNIVHPELGKIRVSRKGINEFINETGNLDKLALVPHLKELIETSMAGEREEIKHNRKDDIVAFYPLKNEAVIDGKRYNVLTKIGVDRNGNLFYTVFIDEKENLASGGVETKSTVANEVNINITPFGKNVKSFLQEGERVRGAYSGNDRMIYLFEHADRSTFLHEMAHAWFDVVFSNTTEQGKAMQKAINEFIGHKEGTEYTTEQLEKFAEGAEIYYSEGKAPNNFLKNAFRNFRNWLVSLWKSIKQPNVVLNDNIRQVYKEMLGGADVDAIFDDNADLQEIEDMINKVERLQEKQQQERNKLVEDTAEVIANAIDEGANMRSYMGHMREKTKKNTKAFEKFLSYALTPISTRAGNIDQAFKLRVRKYMMDEQNFINKYAGMIKPLVDAYNGMDNKDMARFDIYMKNGYVSGINSLAEKYGFENEYAEYRKAMEEIYQMASDVGIKMNHLEAYAPRRIKDKEGLLQYIQSSNVSLIAQMNEEIGAGASLDEKAEWLDEHLGKFAMSDPMKTKPSNAKTRSIEVITPELDKFYAKTVDAIAMYIDNMAQAINVRKMWGATSETMETNLGLDKSIGEVIAHLYEEGRISSTEEEKEVRDILDSLLGNHGRVSELMSVIKNGAYMSMLTRGSQTISQLADIGTSMYRNGVIRTLEAMLGGDIDIKDVGVEKLTEEFRTKEGVQKWLEKMLNWTGFSSLDVWGKNTYLRSRYKKLTQQAKNNPEALKAKLEWAWEGETDALIQDLQNGEFTERVQLLMFSELSDVQPTTRAEMPAGYLNNPNGRVVYMLKTFAIRRMDMILNDTVRLWKEDRKQALSNLVFISLLMGGAEALVSVLRDFIKGKKIDMSDAGIEALMGLLMINRYQVYKAKEEGFSGFVATLVPPMFPMLSTFIEDMWKMIEKGMNPKDMRTWSYIPLIGDAYYWWIGGGYEKNKRKK